MNFTQQSTASSFPSMYTGKFAYPRINVPLSSSFPPIGRFPYLRINVPENATRDEYLLLANASYEGGRFEELVKLMEKMILVYTPPFQLNDGERNMLNKAYKTVCLGLRTKWEMTRKLVRKEAIRGIKDEVDFLQEYKSKIEAEMSDVCNSILSLLGARLLPSAGTPLQKDEYIKMKDYYTSFIMEIECISANDTFETSQALEDAKSHLQNLDENALKESKASMDILSGNFTLGTRKQKLEEAATQVKHAAAAQVPDAAGSSEVCSGGSSEGCSGARAPNLEAI